MKSPIDVRRRRMILDYVHGLKVNKDNMKDAFSHFAKVLTRKMPEFIYGERWLLHVNSREQLSLFSRALLDEIAYLSKVKNGQKAPEQEEDELAAQRTFRVFLDGFDGFERPLNEAEEGSMVQREDFIDGGLSEFLKGDRKGEGSKMDEGALQKKPRVTKIMIGVKLYEGLDLKCDLCRLNVILKAPFANFKDSLTVNLDSITGGGYSITESLSAFLQAAARSVRDENDWALNICLDLAAISIFSRLGDDELSHYIRESLKEEQDPLWLDKWTPPL